MTRYPLLTLSFIIVLLFTLCGDVHAVLDEELTIENIETDRLKRTEQLEALEDAERLHKKQLDEIMEIIEAKEKEMKGVKKEELPAEEEKGRPEPKEKAEKKEGVAPLPFYSRILDRVDGYLDGLHPYVIQTEEFNNNIYLTSHDAKQDLVSTSLAGFKYKIGDSAKSMFHALADGGIELKHYLKSSDSDRQNPYLKGLISKRFNKLTLSAFYSLKRGQRSRADLGEVNTKGDFINYWNTYYRASGKLDLNRLIIRPKVERYKYDYKKDYHNPNSYIEDVITLTNDIKIFSKTYIFTSTNFGIMKYYEHHVPPEDDKDYMYQTYSVGTRGQFSPRFKGLLRAGYQNRKYDNGENRHLKNLDGKLTYEFSKHLKSSARYYTTIEDSTFGTGDGSLRSQRFYLSCKYRPPFLRKFTFDWNGSYSFYDYKFGRDDIKYDTGLAVNYNLNEWMKVESGYNFKRRISDEEFSAEYTNHVTYLRCTFEI